MDLTDVRIYSELCVKYQYTDENGDPAYDYNFYEEESYHRPYFKSTAVLDSVSSSFAQSDTLLYTFTKVTPKKGLELREMELPIDWDEFQGIFGLKKTPKLITAKFSALNMMGSYVLIYGWIDRAEPVATKGPNTNTRIIWHPDYWLIYADYAWHVNKQPMYWWPRRVAIGHGTMKRGPESMARPDPSVPRYWAFDFSKEIKRPGDGDGPYAIVLYIDSYQIGQQSYTELNIAFWGVNAAQIVDGGNTYSTIKTERIYSGYLEETLGIDPDAIVGAWFSPIPPCEPAAVSVHSNTIGGDTYGWYAYVAGYHEKTFTLASLFSDPTATDDLTKYIVTDPYGNAQATLPWGIPFKKIKARADIGTSGAWLILQFLDSNDDAPRGEGRVVQIPLPVAPITSNARSSYILSGQESYDRSMANLQQQETLYSGYVGMANSVFGGGVMGGIAGGGSGALGGAAAGVATSTVGGLLNYYFTGISNDEKMKANNRLLSNQAGSVLISGGGDAWKTSLYGSWNIVALVRDSESAAALSAEQAEMGYITDMFVSDCTSLISGGGGLRIEGLEITGDMNREGKAYIQALFARGVHLDLIQ